jgi:folate-binding protein YgfZ
MNDAAEPTSVWLDDYVALTEHAGFVPLSRTRIEIAGKDRATWLHNLCTNEVKRLAPGRGCEAFITTVQGKTLGHGFIFVEDELIVLDTVADQSETLLKHLDRYLVCEQVTLTDCSGEGFEVLLAGPKAAGLLAEQCGSEVPAERCSHRELEVDGKAVRIRNVDLGVPCFFVEVPRVDGPWLASKLHAAGARQCVAAALDVLRIEQGFPLFGRDLTDKNLPQELARDALAISFVKGCYLGQETVARIDALGHVNKVLVGVRFAGAEVPAVGAELSSDGQAVGAVTSATYSPRLGGPLALAYVKHGLAKPGTRLTSPVGEAEIVRVPLGQ